MGQRRTYYYRGLAAASLTRPVAALLGAAALFLLGLPAAQAQTYVYQGSGTTTAPTSGNFSTGFSPLLTAGGSASTGLTFNGAAGSSYTATDDLAGLLNFSSLTFANLGGVIVAQGVGTTLTEGAATSIALNNTGSLNFGLNLASSGFLTTFSGAGSGTFSGVVSGAGGVTQSGTGIVTFTGFNTYTGSTTVNSGTLALNAGGGAGAVRGVVNVNSGGLLSLNASDALGYSSGSQVTTLNVNGGTVTDAAGNEGYATNFALTGGTLSSSGSGSYNFDAANGYGITSNASAAASLISGNVFVRTGSLNFNVAKGTTASGTDLSVTGAILGGGLTKTGAGSLVLVNAANSFTGNVLITGGTLSVGAGGNYGTNGGNTVLGSDAAAGRTITVNSGGVLSFTQNNIFGSGQASSANLPNLIINSGGLVTSKNYNAIGSVSLNGATLAQNATGTGSYQGYQFLGSVTVGGTAASTISNNYNGGTANAGDHLGSNTQFIVASTGAAGPDLTVSAPLLNQSGDFGNGAGGFTKLGAGTMALTAAGTYTGGTTITAGTLALNAAKADGTGALTAGAGTVVQTGVSNALGGGGIVFTAATLQNTDLTANDPAPAISHPGVSSDMQGSNAAGAADTLTLGSGASILDFGAGNTGAIFSFANSSAAAWAGTLKIYDYTGLPPVSYNPATQVGTTGGGGLDQLFFGSDGTGLTQSQLNDIMFYSGQGTGLYAGPTIILADGEVTAAPEPSVWAGFGLTAFGIGGLLLRARTRTGAAAQAA